MMLKPKQHETKYLAPLGPMKGLSAAVSKVTRGTVVEFPSIATPSSEPMKKVGVDQDATWKQRLVDKLETEQCDQDTEQDDPPWEQADVAEGSPEDEDQTELWLSWCAFVTPIPNNVFSIDVDEETKAKLKRASEHSRKIKADKRRPYLDWGDHYSPTEGWYGCRPPSVQQLLDYTFRKGKVEWDTNTVREKEAANDEHLDMFECYPSTGYCTSTSSSDNPVNVSEVRRLRNWLINHSFEYGKMREEALLSSLGLAYRYKNDNEYYLPRIGCPIMNVTEDPWHYGKAGLYLWLKERDVYNHPLEANRIDETVEYKEWLKSHSTDEHLYDLWMKDNVDEEMVRSAINRRYNLQRFFSVAAKRMAAGVITREKFRELLVRHGKLKPLPPACKEVIPVGEPVTLWEETMNVVRLRNRFIQLKNGKLTCSRKEKQVYHPISTVVLTPVKEGDVVSDDVALENEDSVRIRALCRKLSGEARIKKQVNDAVRDAINEVKPYDQLHIQAAVANAMKPVIRLLKELVGKNDDDNDPKPPTGFAFNGSLFVPRGMVTKPWTGVKPGEAPC